MPNPATWQPQPSDTTIQKRSMDERVVTARRDKMYESCRAAQPVNAFS
jgi:hypothetical protein